MLKVKRGVEPRSLVIAAAVANVAEQHGRAVTITAGTDGTHMHGSRHYTSEALDVRSKDFPDDASKRAFLAAVLARLGAGYQGFLEHAGEPSEHFHIEYDPS